MASTSLDVVNLALKNLGHKSLAALDTTTEIGRIFSVLYPDCRDELLREIRPNFAKKRDLFHQVVDSEITISGATAADPVVITATSHGLSDGDSIAIWNVVGMTDLNGKMYKVANGTTNTFEITDLNGNDIDGTDYDAYVSGGKCGELSTAPIFEYLYRYQLPSDYILLLSINGNDLLDVPHSVEQDEILTNETQLQGTYIFQATDVSTFDKDFVKVLAWKLAFEGGYAVTNQSALVDRMEKYYKETLRDAKGRKSQESGYPQNNPSKRAVSNQWLRKRWSE